MEEEAWPITVEGGRKRFFFFRGRRPGCWPYQGMIGEGSRESRRRSPTVGTRPMLGGMKRDCKSIEGRSKRSQIVRRAFHRNNGVGRGRVD